MRGQTRSVDLQRKTVRARQDSEPERSIRRLIVCRLRLRATRDCGLNRGTRGFRFHVLAGVDERARDGSRETPKGHPPFQNAAIFSKHLDWRILWAQFVGRPLEEV